MPTRPVVVSLVAAALILPTAASAASSSAPPESDEFAVGSDYLAGFDQSTTFEKASIKRFVVPELACTDELTGIVLGLGYEPIEGQREYLAGVVVACVDGLPTYETQVLVNGVADGSSEVTSGDVITAKLVLDGDRLTSTLTNRTNPAGTVSVSATVRSADGVTYGAFPLAGAGSPRLPVPDFGKVRIRHATVAAGSKRLNRIGDPGIRTREIGAAASSRPPDDVTFTLKRVVHCCIR